MRVAARTQLAQERARTQAWRESYDDASISRTLIRLLMRGRGREHEHEQKGGRHEGGHATRKSERAGGGPREGSRKRWQKRISPPKRGSWAVAAVCSKTSEEGGRARKAGRGRLLVTSRYWGSDLVVGRVGQGLHHPTQPREEARQQPAMHAARGKLKLNPLPAAGQDREA